MEWNRVEKEIMIHVQSQNPSVWISCTSLSLALYSDSRPKNTKLTRSARSAVKGPRRTGHIETTYPHESTKRGVETVVNQHESVWLPISTSLHTGRCCPRTCFPWRRKGTQKKCWGGVEIIRSLIHDTSTRMHSPPDLPEASDWISTSSPSLLQAGCFPRQDPVGLARPW